MKRLPAFTLAVALLSVAAFLFPQLGRWLIYDRAAILGGEYWRVFTGHLVHFSGRHLFFNLLVFAMFGAWVEVLRRRDFILLIAASSLGIGVYLLLLDPRMFYYAGLSGLANAAVVYSCLNGIEQSGANRNVWGLLLLLTGCKIALELTTGQALFADSGGGLFQNVPEAHLIGASTALLAWLVGKAPAFKPIAQDN